MTIQEKIKTLTTYLSKMEEFETKNEIEAIIEIASKFFIKGDILKIDPTLLKETYEKWDSILDNQLAIIEKRVKTSI